MTFKSSLFFAKSLIFPKSQKKSSARRSYFGAIICVALSLIPLFVVLSISTGMINGMTQRLIGLSSCHIQAYIYSKKDELKTSEAFINYAKQLKEVEGVVNEYPHISINALACSKDLRAGCEIRAVEKSIFYENSSFKEYLTVESGSLDSFSGNNVAVGQYIAGNLGLKTGDKIRIITMKNVNGVNTPKLSTFNICAIVNSGYQELDQLWIFIPLETAYKSLSLDDATFSAMIETSDPFSPELIKTAAKIKAFFGKYANVYRWNQVHVAEYENFSSTKVMLLGVMVMIVLVASLNISSAIVMLVMERRKEIGILKSFGATSRGITLSFLITGCSTSIAGFVIGFPVSLVIIAFSNQIIAALEKIINFFVSFRYAFSSVDKDYVTLLNPSYYLQKIPVYFPFKEAVFVFIGIILLALLVSVIPSVKAGKEKPVEIFQNL